MFRLFFITIGLLVPISRGFLFGGGDCNDQKDCVSCTTHQSWSGDNCRWCPQDNECHAYLIAVNPCSSSENIVDKHDCSSIVFAKYDRAFAYKMVFLSALAYADNVAKYIPKATEVNSFHLIKQVTKPCSGNAHCSGYTAISHTERAIAISFRGSEHFKQVINEALRALIEPKVSFKAGGKVQAYFNDAFLLLWNELKTEAYKQITSYPSYKVWVTGHSLGGAMASLASTAIAYDRKVTKDNLILYTFGQPRVGNYDYALTHDKLVPISFRVTHYRDIVVHLPTCNKILGVCYAFNGGPYHHGKEIYYGSEIMTRYSSYKKCEGLPHNEDVGCSNSFLAWAQCFLPTEIKKCIKDHEIYFGIAVGTWWTTQ